MEAGTPGESGVHVTLINRRRELDVVTGPLQSMEGPLVAEMVKSLTIVKVCYSTLSIIYYLFPIIHKLSYIIYPLPVLQVFIFLGSCSLLPNKSKMPKVFLNM